MQVNQRFTWGIKPNIEGRKQKSLVARLSIKKTSEQPSFLFPTSSAAINIYGTVDAITFEAFLVKKLIPNLWKNACVIIDNAKFHKGESVRELIEKAGAKLIYLPPYSPEFSPIENFWSKVKAILRKIKPKNYKDLVDGITNAMLEVTKSDIKNWFTHCCYCTS